MPATFQLHPHEVWSKDIISTGEFSGGGDLSSILPPNVWNDSRFFWGRYSPRGRDDFAVGHIIFRPQNGDPTENFFVADKVHHTRNAKPRNMREFVFGSQQVDVPRIENALTNNLWGRVFYFNEDNELRDEQALGTYDWGLFLAANGVGLWKWAKWNGVTWGKASREGIFRWSAPELTPARFLATSSSATLRAYIASLLADDSSEMAYTKRWLPVEDTNERSAEMALWTRGSLTEVLQVLRWLLVEELGRREEELMSASWVFNATKLERDSIWVETDFDSVPIAPKYLLGAFNTLRNYFEVKPKAGQLPLCTAYRSYGRSLRVEVEQPTAHERLEARFQLRDWCDERGLSFD